jgi:cytokinin dehydrogenase
VIDSQSLNKVLTVTHESIDVEAGCTLSALVRGAADAGYRVAVMTDCTMLSVGGFASVGGQSFGSHTFGAFVDAVQELDVVTGDGRLVTCSESHERELFEMTLAGLGQCAIVVRVRLRLLPAPEQVTTRTIVYDAIEPFLDDQLRLLSAEGLDFARGSIVRGSSGTWEYRLMLGMFGTATRESDPISLLAAPGRGRIEAAVRVDFRAFFPGAMPTSAQTAPPPPTGAPPPSGWRAIAAPSLAVWLPASASRDLVAAYLASEDSAGIASIECTALPTDRFRRPLFRVPSEERMFAFWTLRSVFANRGPSLDARLEANRAFLDRALARGAKRYPRWRCDQRHGVEDALRRGALPAIRQRQAQVRPARDSHSGAWRVLLVAPDASHADRLVPKTHDFGRGRRRPEARIPEEIRTSIPHDRVTRR